MSSTIRKRWLFIILAFLILAALIHGINIGDPAEVRIEGSAL